MAGVGMIAGQGAMSMFQNLVTAHVTMMVNATKTCADLAKTS